MSKRKTTYTHPTLMSTADHAALMQDLTRLAPPDLIPTLTARDITDAIRRDSDRQDQAKLTARQRQENHERANRGQDVITLYGEMPGMDPDPSTVLTDLLADLMHAARENPNLHWQSALDSAEVHYTAERNGEDEEAERQERCAAPAHYRGPAPPPAYRTVKTLDGPAPSFCECGRNWDDCSTRDDADPDAQHADRGLQAETPHRGIVGY